MCLVCLARTVVACSSVGAAGVFDPGRRAEGVLQQVRVGVHHTQQQRVQVLVQVRRLPSGQVTGYQHTSNASKSTIEAEYDQLNAGERYQVIL